MNQIPLASRVRGAIYGHLLGDALGVPYEFLRADAIPSPVVWRGFGSHSQLPGTYSDDGALMLCQVASLVDKEAFDASDTASRFLRWYEDGYQAAGGQVFDIGGTTGEALMAFKSRAEPLEAGPTDERANGNGSLMRILPIGLAGCADETEDLIRTSHDASRVTHGHPRSQVCCALHNLALARLLRGASADDAMDAARGELEAHYGGRVEWSAHAAESPAVLGWADRRGSGYVVDSLWSAWDSLSQSVSYRDAVERAVSLGDDTDTTAAIAGGLAGAVWGDEALPREWLEELRLEPSQREMIEAFVSRITTRVAS